MTSLFFFTGLVLVALSLQLHVPRIWGQVGGAVAGLANMLVSSYALHLLALDVIVASALAVALDDPRALGLHAVAWALLGLHLVRRHTSAPLEVRPTPWLEAGASPWSTWWANVLMRRSSLDEVEVTRGLVYRRVAGVSLRLDVYRPKGGELCPSLVYFHGGGWVAGNRRLSRFLLPRLAAAGWTTFAVSYRLAPRFALPAALEDAKAAVAWIREHGTELGAMPGRPIVWGESAGGHLAALLALTPGEPRWQPGFESADTFVRGALLFAPVADLVGPFERGEQPGLRRLLERLAVGRPYRSNRQLYRALDPMRCELRDVPPVLLVQGMADALVPRESSQRLARRLREAGGDVQLLELPGMPHAFEVVPSPVQERVLQHALAFLDEIENSRALIRGRPAT